MRILIASDDRIYARMLYLSLAEKGAEAAIKSPAELSAAEEYDMMLLDAGGFSPDLRLPDIPVVLYGTDAQLRGIDDGELSRFFILPRPFRMSELYGVIFSGRSEKTENDISERKLGIVLDGTKRCVYIKGEKVFLSRREFNLFALLMEKRGTPVSREEAGTVFLGEDGEMKSNVVDVYIKYLREKIDERFDIKLIKTVRGAGHMIGM